MTDKYILVDRKPVLATLEEWARWFERGESARRVAFTDGKGFKVSTVFLGLNQSLRRRCAAAVRDDDFRWPARSVLRSLQHLGRGGSRAREGGRTRGGLLMARSYLSLTQRWRKYRQIPEARRDIFDLIWLLTGYC